MMLAGREPARPLDGFYIMQREAAMRRCTVHIALGLLATVGSWAFAQTTNPVRQYDWSSPLAAAASLARAGDEHDQATVISAYHAANDDERALLRALDEQGAAAAELNKACIARFQRGMPAHSYDAGRDEAEVEGDTAIVYPGGKRSGFGIRWVRVNGEWKLPMSVVLRAHLMSYKTLEKAIAEKRAWMKLLQRTTNEVRAGRYSSPEDVDRRLGDLADAEEPPSSQPTER